MQLQESGEMYLETILILSQENPNVRSIDLANHMGYSKPSISRAVGLLKNGGYIAVDDSGVLHLTEIGLSTARKIYERHTVLTAFLCSLGVDRQTAAEDACKIEHVVSDTTMDALKEYLST